MKPHNWPKVEELYHAARELLLFAGVPFARTHDVIQLVWVLPGDLAPPIPLADLAPLNRYAVEARYPIGGEPISGEEASAEAEAVPPQASIAALRDKTDRPPIA